MVSVKIELSISTPVSQSLFLSTSVSSSDLLCLLVLLGSVFQYGFAYLTSQLIGPMFYNDVPTCYLCCHDKIIDGEAVFIKADHTSVIAFPAFLRKCCETHAQLTLSFPPFPLLLVSYLALFIMLPCCLTIYSP